ncbi:MAG: lipid-A-disaccharide synthase [Desulfobacteraceae bacterium]|nr:lipid-A-disaccharide synthase [Desulfobacteraceae bacterium]
MKKHIFISTGDFSGDLHAKALINTIKQTNKIEKKFDNIKITSIGGNEIRLKSDIFLADTISIEGFGLNGLFKKYLFFKGLLDNKIKTYFELNSPDLIILVDFYGFNIHIAKLAKKLSIPVVYYVSPQVYASREYRVKNIKKYVDKVICIFPFERKIYEKYSVKTEYFGNPLVDIIEQKLETRDSDLLLEKYKGINLIGLMPGSRKSELKSLLPPMLNIIKISKAYKSAKILLFAAGSLEKLSIEQICQSSEINEHIDIIYSDSYALRAKLDFCLTASGTITVENAILGIPMLIMYKLPWLTFKIAKAIVKVEYIGMPNLLAEEEILPEYVQAIDENVIADKVSEWQNNPDKLDSVRQSLNQVKEIIGKPGVIEKAAQVCISFLR